MSEFEQRYPDLELECLIAECDDLIALVQRGRAHIAFAEMGSGSYALRAQLNNKDAVGIGIFQSPGANAIDLSDAVRAKMDELGITVSAVQVDADRLPNDQAYGVWWLGRWIADGSPDLTFWMVRNQALGVRRTRATLPPGPATWFLPAAPSLTTPIRPAQTNSPGRTQNCASAWAFCRTRWGLSPGRLTLFSPCAA